LELAKLAELETPMLILALGQSAGRGRGENAWWSAEGALTFSLILDAREFGLAPERWPQVSLATGLAICEALESLLPKAALKLKWPNDVMLGGKKLSGILSEIPSANKSRIVVGIGINVNNRLSQAPAEVQNRAASLADVSHSPHDLTEVLIRILQQIEAELARLAEGLFKFSKRFRERCWLSGREVRVTGGLIEIQGFCQGIDEDGALLVQTPIGIERILSGTVIALD
jgi:BirA family biotin operon repressor/biotin-[acetyl-CoA-carboxylase] ligase